MTTKKGNWTLDKPPIYTYTVSNTGNKKRKTGKDKTLVKGKKIKKVKRIHKRVHIVYGKKLKDNCQWFYT